MPYGAAVNRTRAEGPQLLVYYLLSMAGIVAWVFVFYRMLREPHWAAGAAGDWIRLLLVVAGGGLATLGFRRMSVEANFMMRPLREGQPTEDGVYGLVRFPVQGGVIVAFLAGALQSPLLAVILAYLAIVWWRWSIWADGLYERTYSTYAAYRMRVRHRFIPYIW
jgi:protein-S-isoprenylcysteine O-methyltransferase Ste14